MRAQAQAALAPAEVVVIDAQSSSRLLGLREIWQRRELLFFFVWRDLKVRYRQTVFGIGWALIQPILLMAIFTLSIGRIPGVATAAVPYAVFALAGLVPWVLFSQGVSAAANSLVGSEAVITKVYFPRLLLPLAAVSSFLIDFAIAFTALLVLDVAMGGSLGPSLLAAVLVGVLTLVSAFGAGTLLSALNVRYRDVRHAIPFLIQAWFFASPVVYSSDLIPQSLRPIYALNPMVGVIEGLRWSLFDGPIPAMTLALSAASGIVISTVALVYFRRVERTFADVI